MNLFRNICSGLALAGLLCTHADSAELPVLGRDILQQLIEINTTHAHGTTVAAKAMADRLLAAGFAPEDVTLLAPPAHPEMGNLVVRLRGRGLDKPLLFMGHLDVVEALRADWNRDPFVLTEQDGWLYGRGTIDMKGQVAAMLAALITLKQQGFVPERDIILALTADEEAGAVANGMEWLLKEHRPLVDAALAINPDAGEAMLKNGRHLYLGAQTSEKVYLVFELEATDKGGHSSAPTAANPIYRLARGLDRLSAFRFPLHLTATSTEYFRRRAQLESGTRRADMLAVIQPRPAKAALDRLSANVETNIGLRTTCTATLIEGGHAENALPQRARATIQCRVIPGESDESVQRLLAGVVADPSLKLTLKPGGVPSPETLLTPAQLAQVETVAHTIWPGLAVLPTMSAGASDNIYTRSMGIPTIGIDGMFDDIDDGRAHGRDERIGVEAFNQELDFTYGVMRSFSQRSQPPAK